MRGRLFKFKLDHEPINSDLDNFLFNIVLNRPNNDMFIPLKKIKENTIEENDFIFFQTNNIISHYALCKKQGPTVNGNQLSISIKNPIKLINPIIKSEHQIFNNTKGQAYNFLSENQIKYILNMQNQNNEITNLQNEIDQALNQINFLKNKIFLKKLIQKYNFSDEDAKQFNKIFDL